MPTISTGLHIVRKKVKGGDRWFVYAWRGGPQIHRQDGRRPVINRELLERAHQARWDGRDRSNTINTLIDLYRDSPAFTGKRPATQREYRLRLNQISERMGRVPIRHIDGREMRGEIVKWRDELADTPRAADRVVGMLSTLFAWAKERGDVANNPAADIRHLHKADRSNLIWEARHWKAVEDIPGHIRRVFVLASLTGLRLADLLSLQWEWVTPAFIAVKTQKTGGEATIPMHAELNRFLTGPGRGPILRNTRLQQWTPDGFQSSWNAVKPEGFDRKTHDIRGTFATRLMIAGFTDQQVAVVTGWTAEKIAAIRARYVDRERVARAMAEQLAL